MTTLSSTAEKLITEKYSISTKHICKRMCSNRLENSHLRDPSVVQTEVWHGFK